MMKGFRQILDLISRNIKTRGGLSVAAVVLLIVALFVIPLPPAILDILLAINIVVTLTLLLRSVLIDDALRLYSFPTLLLFTTLFRLALNVSSTRLILLHGDQGLDAAGHIIESFGNFVVQGDFAVGAIIFVIIAIVNFMVIAKGSARVAEVAARFTLDALPGKQLAIDADLRAGSITREEALQRRSYLARESRFYGAMDGAMRFVQGDAIACLVIAAINAIGGVSIGLSRGMEFSDAVSTFGVLTIGDGLVSILPSLLVSVAAGVVVTHVAGERDENGRDNAISQVMSDSRVTIISAVAVLLLSVLPGFPFLPFFLVGIGLIAWYLKQVGWSRRSFSTRTQELFDMPQLEFDQEFKANKSLAAGFPILPLGSVFSAAGVQTIGMDSIDAVLIELDIHKAAEYLADLNNGYERTVQYYDHVRADVYRTRGVTLPDLVLLPNASLAPSTYNVLVRGRVVRHGSINLDLLYAITGASSLKLFSFENKTYSRHPVDGRPGAWVENDQAGIQALKKIGAEVLLPYQYLAQEAVGACMEVVDDVFGLAEIKVLLGALGSDTRSLADELFSNGVITQIEFTNLIRSLVKDGVNVRDFKVILEGIGRFQTYAAGIEDRAELLSELHIFIRRIMSRNIISDSLTPGGKLRTFVLSQEVEEEFKAAVSVWDKGRQRPPIDPEIAQTLTLSAQKMFIPLLERGTVPIVITCASEIRSAVQEFFQEQLNSPSWLRTLAFEELSAAKQPETVGVLGVG